MTTRKGELIEALTSMIMVCATDDALAAALEAMFDVHECEGRFQPNHYKTPLFVAVRALAKHHGVTYEVMRDRLAERWSKAQRKREEAAYGTQSR